MTLMPVQIQFDVTATRIPMHPIKLELGSENLIISIQTGHGSLFTDAIGAINVSGSHMSTKGDGTTQEVDMTAKAPSKVNNNLSLHPRTAMI